jgi:hypothetical protein
LQKEQLVAYYVPNRHITERSDDILQEQTVSFSFSERKGNAEDTFLPRSILCVLTSSKDITFTKTFKEKKRKKKET